MELWLTKYINEDKFYLTLLEPIITRVKGTNRDAIYVEPGEPIGVPFLCKEGAISLWGEGILLLKDGESRKVELNGRLLG